MADDIAPLADRFGLDEVILGLAEDLALLRAGTISVDNARVRAELGKQIFNGIRLSLNAAKSLEKLARPIALPGGPEIDMEPADG